MCDWNAELHVQRDDWADKILLELLAQDFTPVLSTEGWMMQSTITSAMTAVPAQVHQAKWISLRFVTTQRQKLSWIPGWNHGLPDGLALRSSNDVPIAIKMLGPLVVGIGDTVFLHIPHLNLYDALVHAHACKGVLPGPVRVYLAPPLKPKYWEAAPRKLQYVEIPPSGTNLRELRELEKAGKVAALVTGPYAPHPFRLLAESPFLIELHHMDGMALQHLQVIYPSKNTYPVERPPAGEVDQRPESRRDLPRQVLTQGHDEKGIKGWASSPYLGLFQNQYSQDGAADAEWPRLGQTDRTDPMQCRP